LIPVWPVVDGACVRASDSPAAAWNAPPAWCHSQSSLRGPPVRSILKLTRYIGRALDSFRVGRAVLSLPWRPKRTRHGKSDNVSVGHHFRSPWKDRRCVGAESSISAVVCCSPNGLPRNSGAGARLLSAGECRMKAPVGCPIRWRENSTATTPVCRCDVIHLSRGRLLHVIKSEPGSEGRDAIPHSLGRLLDGFGCEFGDLVGFDSPVWWCIDRTSGHPRLPSFGIERRLTHDFGCRASSSSLQKDSRLQDKKPEDANRSMRRPEPFKGCL